MSQLSYYLMIFTDNNCKPVNKKGIPYIPTLITEVASNNKAKPVHNSTAQQGLERHTDMISI